MQKESKNLFWVDWVRTLTMFGVIVIHVSSDVITEWGNIPTGWWWTANLYDSLVRGCVPVFIMLSGALLLPVEEGYRDFFRKRFSRIAIPFAAWTLLYLLWKKFFYLPDLGFFEALQRVAGGNVCYHLWFLYVLGGVYLITPLLRILVAHASGRDIFYFLMIWFMITSGLPFAERSIELFTPYHFHVNIPIEPAQGFAGYFILGYFVRRYVTEKQVPLAWVGWILSLLVTVAGTGWLSSHFHAFQNPLYDNMAPNVVFYTASFFILMKFMGPVIEKPMRPLVRNLVLDLSKASFGIYLIHPIFLDVLEKGRLGFRLDATVGNPLWMIPLISIGVYLLSFLLIRWIQRIPYLKRIV
jgi:surface polysaccharide O-acyltransferase-like enzyme